MENSTSTSVARVSSNPPKCSGCGKVYSPQCDWRQGRCPNHPGLIDSVLIDNYKSRFYNLLKIFKRKK